MNITVTSEKVIVNGREGYIATATDGHSFTTTHRQNTAEDAENVAVRLFKDGVIDGVHASHDDMRDLNTDDGSTEQPRQVVQYYERAPFSLGKFIIAFIFVVVATVLMSPVIMYVLFPPQ